MCFVDLQKAYDSIYRAFLRDVFVRYGIRATVIAVVRYFHDDDMRAGVRPDESGWR